MHQTIMIKPRIQIRSSTMMTILLILVGRGVPNSLRNTTSRTIPVPLNLLPTPDAAMTIYEQSYNGQLTEPSVYGNDLLEGNEHLQDLRCCNFLANYNIESIFADLVNCDVENFRNAILFYTSESYRLFATL